MTLGAWLLLGWPVVGILIGGTVYELDDEDPSGRLANATAHAFFWPVIIAAMAVVGTVLGVGWVARLPARGVRFLVERRSRPRLPEARAIERG